MKIFINDLIFLNIVTVVTRIRLSIAKGFVFTSFTIRFRGLYCFYDLWKFVYVNLLAAVLSCYPCMIRSVQRFEYDIKPVFLSGSRSLWLAYKLAE